MLALADLFPKAPIYTLLYEEIKTLGRFSGRVIKTSFLDLPAARKNHRAFIPLMPIAAGSLAIRGDYDLIISTSAGYGKGFKNPQNIPHLSYCHTPLRYAWEPDYIENKYKGVVMNFLSRPVAAYLKNWDYRAGQKPTALLANSNFIAEKIKKYYGREAEVVYPPVDLNIFYPEPAKPKKYFLAIGRFMHYKKFDLIINTFNKLGLPLFIVGSGPEEKKMKLIARNSNIRFLPFETDTDNLRQIYANARALIFPQVEDFGLVAAEAIACGAPVIAYNDGGAKEIVNKKTGVLFENQNEEGLRLAIEEFLKKEKIFSPKTIAAEAKRFSRETFRSKILGIAERHAATI